MRKMSYYVLLTLAVMAVGTSCSQMEKSDESVVGYTISAFPVGPALYTVGNRQYVAFYDSLHQMTLAQRTLPDGAWRYFALDEKVKWDSHNYITMCMDNQGVMHLSGNIHASPLVYFCTDASGDIETFHRSTPMVGENEQRTTYPHFMKLDDGRFLFHYRDGGSGNGNEIYNVLQPDGSWKRLLDKPLTDGEGLMNAYMSGPSKGPDGKFHLIWVWRDTPDCATNHDLSYACSPDLVNWQDAQGNPMELPLMLSQRSLIVDPIPAGGGTINGGQRLFFDAENHPMIVYHKYDENRHTQLYITRFENSEWHLKKITDWDFCWDFHGNGSMINELSIGKPTFNEQGELELTYMRFDPKTNNRWRNILTLDATTLEVKSEKPMPEQKQDVQSLPESKFPGMKVNFASDLGEGGYRLRWESLEANRDRKPEGNLPAASVLKVLKVQ
ncbi:MAG: BNR repeat-containing protein [Bacteroidales bacterium]|nr:BNR repeat-containing protein [Bacteroidales bacterium]